MLVRLYRKNPLNPLRVAFLLIRHNVGNISKDLIFKVLYNLHRIILSAYIVVEEIRYVWFGIESRKPTTSHFMILVVLKVCSLNVSCVVTEPKMYSIVIAKKRHQFIFGTHRGLCNRSFCSKLSSTVCCQPRISLRNPLLILIVLDQRESANNRL